MKDEVKRFRTFLAEPIVDAMDDKRITRIIVRGRKEFELVRHGKWIKENIVLTSLPPKSRWHCSGCGSINDGYDESVLTPYCPNCGAKMDADEISNIEEDDKE